jgi:hypothetical protein
MKDDVRDAVELEGPDENAAVVARDPHALSSEAIDLLVFHRVGAVRRAHAPRLDECAPAPGLTKNGITPLRAVIPFTFHSLRRAAE